MRYELPANVAAITVGPHQFTADENGVITVPDEIEAAFGALLHDVNHHNLTPLADAPAEAEAEPEAEATTDEAPKAAAKKPVKKNA